MAEVLKELPDKGMPPEVWTRLPEAISWRFAPGRTTGFW